MTTTLIAAQPDELRALLPWARMIAQAAETELTIVLAQRKKGPVRLNLLPDQPEDDETDLVVQCRAELARTIPAQNNDDQQSAPERPIVRLYQLLGDSWSATPAESIDAIESSVVIAPAPTISKEQSTAEDWQTRLLDELECEVILIQDDCKAPEADFRLAAVLQVGWNNECVLHRAAELATEQTSVSATAVYVQPQVGDMAVSVGMRNLGELLRECLNHYECDAFERRVVVSDSVSKAVQELREENFDLILAGPSRLSTIRRFLRSGSGGSSEDAIPALAVVRPAETFGNRLWSRLDRWVKSIVPQLGREDRVDLVSRIEASSQWDFDFVFLVSLATLIACLGLAEDSGAVIVGAMLVAPLMTPIAGVGLGVAHGNAFLTKVALRTALRGFATAMLIGVLFGLSVQLVSWTGWLEPLRDAGEAAAAYPTEMENRTQPQFYDLLIALASGVAAAYAMGRPNLFAALPGVAIAAALVPPIATSGIALSHGDLLKGGGALLLFVTNMVTITLGTSVVFRAVGIRTQKEGQAVARWPRYSLLLLVVLSILVTILIEIVRPAGR